MKNSSLGEETLAKEICDAQIKLGFPGLIKECQQFIKELDIPNIIQDNIRKTITKNKWKIYVKNEKNAKRRKIFLKKIILKKNYFFLVNLIFLGHLDDLKQLT